ncbi:MAG: hypothetical protein ACT4TC_12395 [Myxococcaceae bacterium]
MRQAGRLYLLALFCASAYAKPWNGIEPGTALKADVVKKFGTPSRVVTTDGKEVLAYFEKQAIKGTTQAQFRVDPTTHTVERIDVFPGPVIDKETVENTYGVLCTPNQAVNTPCYVKKLTDDFRTYLLYSKQGVAIFLNEDGKTVHSFIFQTQKSAAKELAK